MKRSVHSKFFTRLSLAVMGIAFSFTAMAQTTYTTQADGNWNSASTWVGGQIPSGTIAAGKTVVVKHKVTFNLTTDLTVNGTLTITGDTLVFPSSFTKSIKVTNGTLNVTSGCIFQTLSTQANDLSVDGGKVFITANSAVYVSKGFLAVKSAKRSIKNSKLYVGRGYDLNGNGSNVSVDTIQNSIVEVGSYGSGDFHVNAKDTLRVANAYITVFGSSNFDVDGNGIVKVLPNAINNFGFDQLKVGKDLINDGSWNARIDAACIGGSISGNADADIDFTRSQDCGVANLGSAPELIFRNPVLKSGQANKQGAVYRFANVMTGVDAEIKLKKFSRNDIVMQSVDLPSLGWDKAFQPQFGLAGLVQPYQNWYIDFELRFYQAGTNTSKTLPKVDMTALDVDGDGLSVAEYAVFQNPANVMYSSISYLSDNPAGTGSQSFTCPIDGILSLLTPCLICGGDGKSGLWNLTTCTACNGTGYKYLLCNHPFDETTGDELQGPVENFINIDTAATQVMATYQYTDVNFIAFRYGAKSGSQASNGAGIRLNSVWFRQFNLAPPTILPVTLTEFNATLKNKDVSLNWTAHEDNTCSYYAVQRSTDGKNYSDIAMVFVNTASNTNTYTVKDANVSSSTGIVYYRLHMFDNAKEGGLYSPTRIVKLGKEAGAIELTTYPNPVTDQVRVTLPSAWQGKPVMLQLYSANGVLMQSTQISNASQTETMQMGKAVKGFYVVKATCNGEVAQQRIVKN